MTLEMVLALVQQLGPGVLQIIATIIGDIEKSNNPDHPAKAKLHEFMTLFQEAHEALSEAKTELGKQPV